MVDDENSGARFGGRTERPTTQFGQPAFGRGEFGRRVENRLTSFQIASKLEYQLVLPSVPEIPAFEEITDFDQLIDVFAGLKPALQDILLEQAQPNVYPTASGRLDKRKQSLAEASAILAEVTTWLATAPANEVAHVQSKYQEQKNAFDVAEAQWQADKTRLQESWVWPFWETYQLAASDKESQNESAPEFEEEDDDGPRSLGRRRFLSRSVESRPVTWEELTQKLAKLQFPGLPYFGELIAAPVNSSPAELASEWGHYVALRSQLKALEAGRDDPGFINFYHTKLLAEQMAHRIIDRGLQVDQVLEEVNNLRQVVDYLSDFQNQAQTLVSMFDSHWLAKLWRVCEGEKTDTHRRFGQNAESRSFASLKKRLGLDKDPELNSLNNEHIFELVLQSIRRKLEQDKPFEIAPFVLPTDEELINHPDVEDLLIEAEAWIDRNQYWVNTYAKLQLQELQRMLDWLQMVTAVGLADSDQVGQTEALIKQKQAEINTSHQLALETKRQIESSFVIKVIKQDPVALLQLQLKLLGKNFATEVPLGNDQQTT